MFGSATGRMKLERGRSCQVSGEKIQEFGEGMLGLGLELFSRQLNMGARRQVRALEVIPVLR